MKGMWVKEEVWKLYSKVVCLVFCLGVMTVRPGKDA